MNFMMDRIINFIISEGWEKNYEFEGYNTDGVLEDDAENILEFIKKRARGMRISVYVLWKNHIKTTLCTNTVFILTIV